MTILVLDFETVRDESIPFEPKEPDEFPPAACWQLVSAGAMVLRGDRFGVIGGDTEADKVRNLVAYIEKEKPRLVTWNGRNFDMPVLCARALKYGLRMPWWFAKGTKNRYTINGHWDLKDWLSDHGAGRIGHLDQAARLIGFPGKFGVSGADVAKLYAEGRQAEIDAYCLCDVAQTAALALRCALLGGEIDHAEYMEHATKLLKRIEAEPRTRELASLVDRKAFLFEQAVPVPAPTVAPALEAAS